MKTVFSEDHRLYQPRFDIVNGRVTESASPASNADLVLDAVRRDLASEVLPPIDHGRDPLLWLHHPGYIRFLEHAWEEWVALCGDAGEALPLANVQRGMRQLEPECIDGRISYYALDTGTPINAGTWPAVYAAAQVALTAADLVADGEPCAYALARPGGHHAGFDYYGGYCFISTEGLAIETLRRAGADRVAYLDVDYHHCNGTQALFYARDDVLTVSLHCDPRHEYPYFSGYADERGEGTGEGCNLNLPLSPGATWAVYEPALAAALDAIRRFRPDALVLLVGVDTYKDDRISKFALEIEDLARIGTAVSTLRLPTVMVKGGGYCEHALDRGVTALLGGFLGR